MQLQPLSQTWSEARTKQTRLTGLWSSRSVLALPDLAAVAPEVPQSVLYRKYGETRPIGLRFPFLGRLPLSGRRERQRRIHPQQRDRQTEQPELAMGSLQTKSLLWRTTPHTEELVGQLDVG